MTGWTKFLIPVFVLSLQTVNARSQSVFRNDASYPAYAPSRVHPSDGRPVFCDNSELDYFPEIISQYGGSCAQASAIHYLFTYEMNRFLDRPAKGHPENVFSYRWIWHLLNGGVDQGSVASDGIEIVRKAGCISVMDYGNEEDDYNFTWPSGYERYYRSMPYRAKSINEIELGTMDGIETLMDYFIDKHDGHKGGGVVSFSMGGGSEGENLWGFGQYDGPSSCGINTSINVAGSHGPHAMTLVGYDLAFEKDFDGDGMISEQEKGAFILVNSWGTWWQSNGKTYMPFYYLLNAGTPLGVSWWDTRAMAIDVDYKVPEICFEVNLDYSSRNDLVFRFGVADGAQADKPDRRGIISYPFPANQGGDKNMKGNVFATGMNISMGFDVSELDEYSRNMKSPCWFLYVNKSVVGKAGTGHVNYVRVHDYRSGKEVVYESDGEKVGLTVGINYVKIPTGQLFKSDQGTWYSYTPTSANPVVRAEKFKVDADFSQPMAVRTADMKYAKVRIVRDKANGMVKLEVVRYE